MTVANFADLCRDLCEVTGASAPDLAPDESGGLALEIQLTNVDVVLAHEPTSHPNRAVATVTLGQLPAGRELDACHALLNINIHVLGAGSAFSRDPVTGDVVLRHIYHFGHATAVDLYLRLMTMAEAVTRWRQHYFLMEVGQGAEPEAMAA